MNAVNLRNFVMLMFCIKKNTNVTGNVTSFIFKKGTILYDLEGTLMYGIEFLHNYKLCSMISQQHAYLDLTPFILLKYT